MKKNSILKNILIMLSVLLLYFNNAAYSENIDKLYEKNDLFSEVLEKIQKEYVNKIFNVELVRYDEFIFGNLID